MGNQTCHCSEDTKQLTKELEILRGINKQEYFSAIQTKQKIKETETTYQSLGQIPNIESNKSQSLSYSSSSAKDNSIIQGRNTTNIKAINNKCLIEGTLMKFNHKCANNMVSRYCQLTESAFKYYTTHLHAVTWLSKPLVQIPLEDIIGVRMYSVI